MALPLSSVARLEEFRRSAMERVGPQDVVQYRNEILPLVHISRILGRRRRRPRISRFDSRPSAEPSAANSENDTMSVVVLAGQGQRVGLVVDRILDIAEETIASRSTAHRSGVLFTAVIQERVTEFLDVESILRSVDPPFHSITMEL
jgi:two-component system chemotaxis sensor kinase CheA